MPKIKSVLSALVLLLACSTFCRVDSASAQCPDATWTSGFSTVQYLPGTSCEITIWYCMKDSDSKVMVYIYEIDPTPDGGCDGIGNDIIVKAARTLVLNDPAVNRGVPCYKGSPTIINVYTAQCWTTHPTIEPAPPDPVYGLYPCPGGALCEKTCYACSDATGLHITGCYYTPPETSIICNVSSLNWTPYECYTIGCED